MYLKECRVAINESLVPGLFAELREMKRAARTYLTLDRVLTRNEG